MNKFNIGDVVWIVDTGITQKWMMCPDCMGKKFLTVILGDGSKVTIDCAGCQAGFDPPTGKVSYYEWSANTKCSIVRKVEIEVAAGKTKITYGFEDRGYVDESDVFKTIEEAMARAKELAEERNKAEIERISTKEKPAHTWSWNACYHRRQIKEAERNLEYHKAKLEVAKTKAKEKDNGQ